MLGRVFLEDLRRTWNTLDGGTLQRAVGCARAPGVHAVAVYRFGQWLLSQSTLARLPGEPVYQALSLAVQATWGIELPRRAQIGPGLYIGHCGGIVVSEHAVIGRNCALSQGVTIGVSGQGDRAGAPAIGDDVYIAPGACVFGKIRVGNNVKIGANAVVHKDVPDDAVAVLDPGFKIISFKGNRPVNDAP